MMRSTQCSWGAVAVLALAVGLLAAPANAGPSAVAAASVSPLGIHFQPSVQFQNMTLTVSGPEGLILRREFAAGAAISFEAVGDDGSPLPDGAYTYELVAAPVLDRATRRALAAARQSGDDAAIAKLQAAGKLPRTPMVQSGAFKIAGGALVQDDLKEPANRGTTRTKGLTPTTSADQVIPDDLIVQGSLCVGFDCVNNENFGFDTIRLKENNTRIKFEDTSVGTFPTNDWQLTANDSASGGSSKFSIEDITGAKVPFTITAGAATNSIFADSTGRIGLRTSTPVLDLHIATSNTPAIRLEQNNSGGFTAQTWDIAGNEANFFVRDVTSGSRLPFRIRPGAPTSSIDISADGDVGIGTASPATKLHVTGSSGSTQLRVEETSGTAAQRTVMRLENNGGIDFVIRDDSASGGAGVEWSFQNVNAQVRITDVGDVTNEMVMDQAGNVTFAGTVTPGSSRTIKEQFNSVDSREVLQRVLDLPIMSWSYKAAPGVRHVGPMSEDFFAAFQVGADDKGISVTDSAGVALAAIQGLSQVIQEKDEEIAQLSQTMNALQQQNKELADRLATFEKMLKSRVE